MALVLKGYSIQPGHLSVYYLCNKTSAAFLDVDVRPKTIDAERAGAPDSAVQQQQV